MTFNEIITITSEAATKVALPLYFGDDAAMNVKANDISGDFLSFDVTGSNTPSSLSNIASYAVVLRSMGTSYFMNDEDEELNTLVRTDLTLSTLLRIFACKFNVENLNTRKVQNQYDTAKSGWVATFNVTDGMI